jgi:hypothetical protein
MVRSIRIIAIVLLFFNGVSAIFGGGGLILDPSGALMQMPIELLEFSPFNNFLIPGFILFIVNGLFNLFVGILGIRKNAMFPSLTIVCGLLLIAWLTIQIVLIKDFYPPAHLPYYLIGIPMIFLGFKLRAA